jgi:SAM-dependent methyltransferase
MLSQLYSVWQGMSGSDDDMLALINSYSCRQDMNSIFSFMRESKVPPEFFAKKKVLEIGGGYSSFLPRAVEYQMDVESIDPGHETASFTERHFGIPVYRYMLHQVPEHLKGKYHLIYSKDTLEHHADPGQSLRLMLELLEPGGWLLISVPNLHSRSFELTSITHPYYAFPEHLNYFSCNAFRLAFERLNMTGVHVSTTTLLSESSRCMDACIKLGLAAPDETSYNEWARQEKLERVVAVAQRP